jgi:isopentenyldiphosphate isomerase
MDELIDIVDKYGNASGLTAPKSEIHKEGHYHHTSHLWLFNLNEEVLLQQRGALKSIHPLLWDVSVAGHIDAGETPEQAAIREAKEEIGIELAEDDLLKIGVFEHFQSYPNGIVDNEFHNTFIAKTNLELKDFTLQKEEVEDLKFVSLKEFKILLDSSDNNGHFVSDYRDYYLKVIEAILDELGM